MKLNDPAINALFPGTRSALIGLLYGQVDQAFYLREIAARTGVGVGPVQRELKRLTEAGLIRRFERGRHVYFQADGNCPIHDEIKSIVTKTVGAAAQLTQAIAPLARRVIAAFIFGSAARGALRNDSDIDLMVVGDASFAQVVRVIRPVERSVGRPINPIVYSPAEFRARYDESDHFIRSVLQADKVYVAGDSDELGKLLEQRMDQPP